LKFRPKKFKIENCRFENGKAAPKCATMITKRLWGSLTPFSYYRSGISEKTIRKSLIGYVRKQQPGECEEENEAMVDYLFQILCRVGTTEFALFKQFEIGLHAHKPLAGDDRLGGDKMVPFPISIVFGDRDWMDTRGSVRIVMRNKFFMEGLCNLYILKNSGH